MECVELDKSVPKGASLESNTQDDAPQAKVLLPAHQQKRDNSVSHGLLDARQENAT
jgi:hypothetical protein